MIDFHKFHCQEVIKYFESFSNFDFNILAMMIQELMQKILIMVKQDLLLLILYFINTASFNISFRFNCIFVMNLRFIEIMNHQETKQAGQQHYDCLTCEQIIIQVIEEFLEKTKLQFMDFIVIDFQLLFNFFQSSKVMQNDNFVILPHFYFAPCYDSQVFYLN